MPTIQHHALPALLFLGSCLGPCLLTWPAAAETPDSRERPRISIEEPATGDPKRQPAPETSQKPASDATPAQPQAQPTHAGEPAPQSEQLEQNIPVPDSSSGFLSRATGTQKEQISCNPRDCIVLPYEAEGLEGKVRDLMSEQAGKILVQMDAQTIGLHDEAFDPMLTLMREASRRDGTIVIEPIYIGVRSLDMIPLPAVKDILSATVGVVRRVINWVKFRHTGNYHAKVVFNPVNRSVILVYFVHKRYGDVCTTLMSNCDDLEYLDDDTFDQMLSQRLQRAREQGRTVRVTFNKVPARLPQASLALEDLRSMNQSTRLYKWLIASGKAEKKQVVRERFLPAAAIAAAIDYAMTAYDLVKTIILYAPARSMHAEVIYTGQESGGSIQTVTFTPAAP